MAKGQKKRGKYSRTSKKRQHANKLARDRRYRAAQRQRGHEVDAAIARGELSPPQTVDETIASLRAAAGRDRPADVVDAAAEANGDDQGNPVPTPPADVPSVGDPGGSVTGCSW